MNATNRRENLPPTGSPPAVLGGSSGAGAGAGAPVSATPDPAAALLAHARKIGAAPAVPAMRQLVELRALPARNPGELFQRDFLSSGGACLLVSGTGLGKSTLLAGLSLHAAVGLPYMGLVPVRPLRCWLIQAENDDFDLRDFYMGADFQLRRAHGDAVADAAWAGLRFAQVNSMAGAGLMGWIRQQLDATPAEQRPELLLMDPAFAFIEGDAIAPADVSEFCRRQLNPLLTQYRIGLFLVHHANKPRKDAPPMTGGDFAYQGSGGAEWGNWARAVLNLNATAVEGVFELRAGKRGGRLGWTTPDGLTRTWRRFIAHSSEPGEPFFWREATADEIGQLPPERRTGAGRPSLDMEVLCRAAVKLCKRRMPLAAFKDALREETGVGRQAAGDVVRRASADGGPLEVIRDGAAWCIRPRGLL